MTVEALVSSTQLLDLAGYFADRGEEAHAINLLVAANTLKKWEVAFAQEGATATTHEDVNTLDVQAGAVKGGATVSTHEDNTPPSPRKSPEYVASWFYWEEDGLEQTLVMRIPAGGRRKRAGRGYAQEWVVRAVVEALAQRAEKEQHLRRSRDFQRWGAHQNPGPGHAERRGSGTGRGALPAITRSGGQATDSARCPAIPAGLPEHCQRLYQAAAKLRGDPDAWSQEPPCCRASRRNRHRTHARPGT